MVVAWTEDSETQADFRAAVPPSQTVGECARAPKLLERREGGREKKGEKAKEEEEEGRKGGKKGT